MQAIRAHTEQRRREEGTRRRILTGAWILHEMESPQAAGLRQGTRPGSTSARTYIVCKQLEAERSRDGLLPAFIDRVSY